MTASLHLLLIQTILSVLEFHQISTFALADFTADREFHPALKTFLIFSCLYHYIRQTLFLSTKVLSMQNLHFRAFAKWQAVHVASHMRFLRPARSGQSCKNACWGASPNPGLRAKLARSERHASRVGCASFGRLFRARPGGIAQAGNRVKSKPPCGGASHS